MKDQITYRDLWRYKYQLMAEYSVKTGLMPPTAARTEGDWVVLSPDGTLHIKDRYAWDGPSGPTFDTHTFMRPSLVHDALYQLMRAEQLDPDQWREDADKLLYKQCRQDGMNSIRARYVYLAVRVKGGKATKPRPPEESKRAPRR